jgi:hypothetical protein
VFRPRHNTTLREKESESDREIHIERRFRVYTGALDIRLAPPDTTLGMSEVGGPTDLSAVSLAVAPMEEVSAAEAVTHTIRPGEF